MVAWADFFFTEIDGNILPQFLVSYKKKKKKS